MPPILSGPVTPLESSESQARDAPRLPGFVVPQSFDPATYYAQFYRSGLDSDGRISPFHAAGAANKYNGNTALVSAQTSQTPQELQGGVPLVLSSASPTPLVTQAAGVMQSSITATQQPLPVFRQPTGVHLPHYPPNYIPYGPYFSPFYVPPPALHQFLSNGAYPQQPQAGSLYPTAPGTTAKYSVSQYKQGTNTGSSTLGVPGNYGPYGLSMANYTSGSATAAVSSTSNEDVSAPQVKENNVYVSGQQNEGSGVWFTTHSRTFLPCRQVRSTIFLRVSWLSPLHSRATEPSQGFSTLHRPLQQQTVHSTFAAISSHYHPVDMGTNGQCLPAALSMRNLTGRELLRKKDDVSRCSDKIQIPRLLLNGYCQQVLI
ncbi:UNVERIFIED_CONTAM: GBF-interacting protein 1 [Sesamum latifolium]|uniref:GBF-interacting protein 1 n=1 Tax=Sesamum latifolium TaxID=2727402 RepID=A0AAW2WVP4_9LAMI